MSTANQNNNQNRYKPKPRNKNNTHNSTQHHYSSRSHSSPTSEYVANQNKDYKIIYASKDTSDTDEAFTLLTAENIQNQSEQWMYQALERFDNGGKQYSVSFNEESSASTSKNTTIDDIKELTLKAQNDIKRFHREVNVDEVMTNAITSTYDEGTCIMYLRSKQYKGIYHHVIDKYPLGVAIVSDYTENTIPRILIDTTELTNRLQKTTLKSKKNKPLFFANTTDEIKNNYPKEVIDAYTSKEKYAVLDVRRAGTNRFGNLNRKYGISPIFKALKPKIMLDTFDQSDSTNAKAKAKKIILQTMRKEIMGTEYTKKGLEDTAYAHIQLMSAWRNPTVVYTAPPCVEKIQYVEPKVELTNEKTITQYRSRVTSALGISFLNTDGQQTVSTANISIKQLMRTINKIAERQEKILHRWYEIVLEEAEIPLDYCPTPHILDAELLEFEMKQDLAEFLYSKLNCSYRTAYETLGMDFNDEMERRNIEKEHGIDEIFTPHPTSYNSPGDASAINGRPSGSTNGDNEVDEKKQEYDKNRTQSVNSK